MNLGMERVAPWPLGGAAASPMDGRAWATEDSSAGLWQKAWPRCLRRPPSETYFCSHVGPECSAFPCLGPFSPAAGGKDAWKGYHVRSVELEGSPPNYKCTGFACCWVLSWIFFSDPRAECFDRNEQMRRPGGSVVALLGGKALSARLVSQARGQQGRPPALGACPVTPENIPGVSAHVEPSCQQPVLCREPRSVCLTSLPHEDRRCHQGFSVECSGCLGEGLQKEDSHCLKGLPPLCPAICLLLSQRNSVHGCGTRPVPASRITRTYLHGAAFPSSCAGVIFVNFRAVPVRSQRV